MAVDWCWPLTPLRSLLTGLSSGRPQNQGLMSTPPTPVLFWIPPVSDYSDIFGKIDLFKIIFQHNSLFLKRLFKTLDKFGYVTFHGYPDILEIEAKDELIYHFANFYLYNCPNISQVLVWQFVFKTLQATIKIRP